VHASTSTHENVGVQFMSQHHIYRFDDFVVDPEAFLLRRDGEEVHLEPVVLKLLIYLITHRDRLVSRQELMDTVWGDTVISESALSKAVARLRKALDDDSADPRYLRTVHSQGYRFVAEVEEAGQPGQPTLTTGETRSVSARKTLRRGVTAAVVVAVLAVAWVGWLRQDAAHMDGIQSLAVLPLANLTGNPEQEYFADGIQDMLITELSQISGLRVTSRQSMRRYRDSQLPTTDIADELGVDFLVEGSLLQAGNDVAFTIQLIHGSSDEHLWAERYTRSSPYVLELVSDVANAIGSHIGSDSEPLDLEVLTERPGAVDPRAIDAYSLGLAYLDRFTPGGIRSAIDEFEKAVALEPDFALGWGQLAAAFAMEALYGYAPPRAAIEKARAAALRAVESDDQFYIGHSTLGWVKLWTGDLDGACESFDKALQLNPSAPYALHGDADCLMLEGRMDESIARTRDLLVVGPFSAMHNRPLVYHLFLARRYEEAVVAGKAMQARTPQFSMHWFFARVYWQQGLFDEALEEDRHELARRGHDDLVAALDAGLDAAGPTGAMRAVAEGLADRSDESYVDPFRVAETFARAGLADEALDWLEKAVDYGSYEITYMALEPEFDPLHDDPRFYGLLERVFGSAAQDIGRLANSNRRHDR
jgi:TolB-like protein